MKRIAIFVAGALLLGACGEEPEYHKGQMVISKLSGQKGMVLGSSECAAECIYWVRFASLSITTDTHVLAQDGPVQIEPFSTIRMRAFELEPAR